MHKNKNYTYRTFFYSVLLSSYLQASEEGCIISSVVKDKVPTFKIREEGEELKQVRTKNLKLSITERLNSITIFYENQKIEIKRTPKSPKHTCPPFCIQPMNIKGILTVGELEVLDFIKGLNGKEARLLIDIRKNKQFKQHTIPGSINIPYSMLKDHSKYQQQVLSLLGGKKYGDKWVFKSVPKLLIFGASNEKDDARKAINTLLKLSYPNTKIYYYRAGIEGWSNLQLTLY
jgi:hypothetical protein